MHTTHGSSRRLSEVLLYTRGSVSLFVHSTSPAHYALFFCMSKLYFFLSPGQYAHFPCKLRFFLLHNTLCFSFSGSPISFSCSIYYVFLVSPIYSPNTLGSVSPQAQFVSPAHYALFFSKSKLYLFLLHGTFIFRCKLRFCIIRSDESLI